MELVSNVTGWPATEVLRMFTKIRTFVKVAPSFLSNCFDTLIVKLGQELMQNVQHASVGHV